VPERTLVPPRFENELLPTPEIFATAPLEAAVPR
jgi:hypothetical protein